MRYSFYIYLVQSLRISFGAADELLLQECMEALLTIRCFRSNVIYHKSILWQKYMFKGACRLQSSRHSHLTFCSRKLSIFVYKKEIDPSLHSFCQNLGSKFCKCILSMAENSLALEFSPDFCPCLSIWNIFNSFPDNRMLTHNIKIITILQFLNLNKIFSLFLNF